MTGWVKLKRNDDGTYSLSGSEGRVDRGPLKHLLKTKIIDEKELYAIVKRAHAEKKIDSEEYNYIIKEIVIESL